MCDLAKRLHLVQAQMLNSGRLGDTNYRAGDTGGQYYYEIDADILENLVRSVQEIVDPPKSTDREHDMLTQLTPTEIDPTDD